MATKHNWLKTNISDRLNDHSLNFKVWHNEPKIETVSWEKALYDTIEDLSCLNKKLYVPLSGGMDSEFVIQNLKRLNPIPIIVDTPGNKLESSYAFHYCKKHKLNPIIIEKTESEMLKTFYHDIFMKLNGYGINATASLIASRYTEDHGGVSIIAEHAYDGVSEWDFYNDALINIDNSIYFFMWTPELVKAMRNEYQGEDHQEFKHRLYDVPFRPKFNYQYSRSYNNGMSIVTSKRVSRPKYKDQIIL